MRFRHSTKKKKTDGTSYMFIRNNKKKYNKQPPNLGSILQTGTDKTTQYLI